MTALALFASTFVLVFALGFQSLNVNHGHYLAAALTSLVIGSSQMVLFQLAPDANWIEIVGFIGGGPLGIVASMWVHRRTLGRKRKEPEAPDYVLTFRGDIARAIEEFDSIAAECRDIAARQRAILQSLNRHP